MAADSKNTVNPNPLLKAGFLSKLSFWWMKDILWYSRSHDLVAKDLYYTIPGDRSESLGSDLESVWNRQVGDAKNEKKKPSLWTVIVKTYSRDFLKYAVLLAIYTAIQLVQPTLLQLIMSYFRATPRITSTWAYLAATMFVVLDVLRVAFLAHGSFHLSRLGMRARIACSSLIYKKMIRLPSSANRRANSSIISLFSIDVAKLEVLFYYAPFVVTFPLQLLVATWLICRIVGFYPAIVGVALMVLQTFPIQVWYSKMLLKLRAKQAASTDNRIYLIGEIVNGMRAVKMYVWERYLEKLVHAARSNEIAHYLKISYLSSVTSTFIVTAHRLCGFAVMLTYELHRGLITVDQILPVMQHFANMRNICFFFFTGLKNVTDAHVSIRRIEDFLLLDEVTLNGESNGDAFVSIENATVAWNEKTSVFKDVSLNFAPKKLHAVVGPVGSGKSSLLKLILGELETSTGKVSVRGKVSYSSQEPWLFNGSVRDNILFGENYDTTKYQKVVSACALVEDFIQLPHGDKTLVGEGGSCLSGGQRSRVNLARAVYRDADIYLLDDPFSAVDARVAKTITKDCINGLLRDKTRILVTHSIRQLDDVAEIVVLNSGKVEFQGIAEDFKQNNKYSTRMISDEKDATEECTKKSEIRLSFIGNNKSPSPDDTDEQKETEELIAKGAMKASVYSRYIEAGGYRWALLTILTNILFVMAASTFDVGLAVWSTNADTLAGNETDTSVNEDFSSREKGLFVLGALIALTLVTTFVKTLVLFRLALNVGRNIHDSIFSRVMNAPMRFFEANSAGKILNRFSEDTGVVDNVLPMSLTGAMNVVTFILAAVVSAIIANWWILILICVFLFVSLLVGKICVRAIQKVKRLVGIAKSPILSFASSSLAGATTIRACRAETIVIEDFDSRQNRHTEAQFLSVTLIEAFSLWLQLINLGLLASITYACVFLKNDDTYEGWVGLSLMQVFAITELTSATGSKIAEVLANMTSVERMLQFTELEQEALVEKEPGSNLPSSWPDRGQIRFERLYLRYSVDGDPTLWDVGCTIEAGSKVGIAGRTGAGKSSLISALFRFAKTDGFLYIDGVDTKTIDLHRLRSKISIIPQESVLFRGTLRKNLDPSGKFDDAALWSALESVELKHMFNSLDYHIENCGSNLSVGQRQLLCLARAIIVKNKILILDEATANIDSTTDALIQKTIRSQFKERTVLTIAHRLETIMDCDKVLVMDGGRLVEYDHPSVLLQNNHSYLYKMIEPMGKAMMQNLTDIAREAYTNQKNTDK